MRKLKEKFKVKGNY